MATTVHTIHQERAGCREAAALFMSQYYQRAIESRFKHPQIVSLGFKWQEEW
jgi:hypothetical protein